MPSADLVNLSELLDDAKCFALVRQHRWPEGVRCPGCGSDAVIRDGCDDTQPCRQRYRCKTCAGRFDDLTGTVLAGRHRPLRVWGSCLYLMGLHPSDRQLAQAHGPRPSRSRAPAAAGTRVPVRTGGGRSLANRRIAQELGLNLSDTQAMTEALRRGLTAKAPAVVLDGEVEIDEVYVAAGHKGNPAALAKKDVPAAAAG